MKPVRALTAFGLCLFMALTSVTLAVARGVAQPVGERVLCAEGIARSVPVDADGTPIAPPHACPDCMLVFHATEPLDPMPAPRMACATAKRPFAVATHPVPLARPEMLARAPPRPV